MSIILRRPYTQKPPAGVQVNTGHPQLRGCVGWWPMLEGGGSVRDAINDKHGTFGTDVTWGASEKGRLLNFTSGAGVDLGSITSNDPLSLAGLTTASWCAWIRWLGSGDTYQRIIDKSDAHDGANGWAYYMTLGWPIVRINGDSSGALADTQLTAGVWHHIVATFDASRSNDVEFFLDGVADGDDALINTTLQSTTTNAHIGAWNTSDGRSLSGDLADVRVYNRTLTDAEVKNIYQNPWAPFSRNIYIPFAAAATTSYFLPFRRPYTQKPPAGVLPNLGHPHLDGCYGWWTNREGGGSTLRDEFGKYNASLVAGTSRWEVGPAGVGIEAQNDTDRWGTNVEVVHPDHSFTWMAQVYWLQDTNDTWQGIMGNGIFAPGFFAQLQGEFWGLYFGGNRDANTALLENTLYFLVAAFDAPTNTVSYWLNGVPDGGASFSDFNIATDTVTFLQAEDDGSGRAFQGIIHQARMYSGVLSEPLIKEISLNPWAPFERRIWVPMGAAAGGEGEDQTVTLPLGTLGLTGQVHTVVTPANKFINLPLGTLGLTGQVHQTVVPYEIQLPLGTLGLTGQVHTVVTPANKFANLPLGTLGLTGQVHAVDTTEHHKIDLPLGTLGLAGQIHTVLASENKWVDLPVGTLGLTGQIHSVAVGGPEIALLPLGTLGFTGKVHTVDTPANKFVEVPKGTLGLTGQVHTVDTTEHHKIELPLGTLGLTGQTHTVLTSGNETVELPLGFLGLTGRVHTVDTPDNAYVELPVGTLGFTGQIHTVEVPANAFVELPLGALVLTGQDITVYLEEPTDVQLPLGTLVLTGQAPKTFVSTGADSNLTGPLQVPLSPPLTDIGTGYD